MSGHADMAEMTLKESIKLARAAKDPHIEAVTLNNLANLYSYRNRPEDAVKQYKAAIDLASNHRDGELETQACSNLARAALTSGDYEDAKMWAQRTVEKASKLPDSHDKAYQLLSAGRTFKDAPSSTKNRNQVELTRRRHSELNLLPQLLKTLYRARQLSSQARVIFN